MSTPQNKIPPYTPAPSDATKFTNSQRDNGDVGWREFVRQFIPEKIRDVVLPSTPQVRIMDAKKKIDESLPYTRQFPAGSEERRAEIDRLFDIRQTGGGSIISPTEESWFEKVVPVEIREFLGEKKEEPLNKAIKAFSDISGLSNPIEAVEGPAKAATLGMRTFNRIDDAINSAKQTKATGAQWLKQISTNVPEQERSVLRPILEANKDKVYTKDEIKSLLNENYKAPVLEEERFGGSEYTLPERRMTTGGYRYGNDYDLLRNRKNTDYGPEGSWDLYSRDPNTDEYIHIGSFKGVDEAEKFMVGTPQYPEAKWEQYTMGGGRDYEEIVITTPEGGVYEKPAHWEDIENPVAHLRMTTRSGTIGDTPINVSQVDELQSDWAQDLRRAVESGTVRPEDINKMPEVKLPAQVDVFDDGMTRREFKYGGLDWRIDTLPKPDGTEHVIVSAQNVRGTNQRYTQIFDDLERAKKHIKTVSYVHSTPNMRFGNTNEWVDLSLGRALQRAIDEGTDYLTWAPGELQYHLYGSNMVRWQQPVERTVRNTPLTFSEMKKLAEPYVFDEIEILDLINLTYDELIVLANTNHSKLGETASRALDFLEEKVKAINSSDRGLRVKAKKQHAGDIPGIGGLEEAALNMDPAMFGKIDEIVKSKDELRKIIEKVAENPNDVDRFTDKLWGRMQSEREGISLPRKEGMEYFYDKIVPTRLKELLKKMGFKGELEEITVSYDNYKYPNFKQKALKITPELKKFILEKGIPLFGAVGAAGLTATTANRGTKEDNEIDKLFQ